MALRIGLFRHRVEVLRPVRGVDPATGAPTLDWQPWLTRKMDVRPQAGAEAEASEKVEARTVFRVHLRFIEGLTTQHRLRLRGGQVLKIHDLRSFMLRKQFHEALCTEVAHGGT